MRSLARRRGRGGVTHLGTDTCPRWSRPPRSTGPPCGRNRCGERHPVANHKLCCRTIRQWATRPRKLTMQHTRDMSTQIEQQLKIAVIACILDVCMYVNSPTTVKHYPGTFTRPTSGSTHRINQEEVFVSIEDAVDVVEFVVVEDGLGAPAAEPYDGVQQQPLQTAALNAGQQHQISCRHSTGPAVIHAETDTAKVTRVDIPRAELVGRRTHVSSPLARSEPRRGPSPCRPRGTLRRSSG